MLNVFLWGKKNIKYLVISYEMKGHNFINIYVKHYF